MVKDEVSLVQKLAPRHEDMVRSGDIALSILNVDAG
jgi:hypothetical protein